MSDSVTHRQLLAGGARLAALAAAPAAAQPAAARPDWRGKSIPITGASTGFGHVGTLLYARAGAKVIASTCRGPRPRL